MSSEVINSETNVSECRNETELCKECENSFINVNNKRRERNELRPLLTTSTPLAQKQSHSSTVCESQQIEQQLSNDYINNNNNNSFDDLITGDNYEQSLSQLTHNKFLSLRQLEAINGTDEQSIDRNFNIYGIVNSVNNINDSHKKVSIIDPTNSHGICFILNNFMTNIATKNILRLTNISVNTSTDGKIFSVNERKNFAQFIAFTYDYECDNDFDYELVFSKNNLNLETDKSVSKLLEEWFAQRFLKNNCLNNLQMPSNRETYVDFAGLVIGTQLMKQTIQLTIYDGTEPNFVIEDQFRGDYAVDCASNSYHRFNNDEVYQNCLNPKHFGFVNVWKNKTNQHNEHYDIAEGTTLMNGDDLLVFFNVELMKGSENNSIKLNLRSGRHHGKGIRKVSRLSVLGKKLISRIRAQRIRHISENLNAIQELTISNLSDFTINASEIRPQTEALSPRIGQQLSPIREQNSQIFKDLLKLGSRKLDALLDQQIKEKDYPLIYRNAYEWDFNLIKEVLEKSRQLSRFPITAYSESVPKLAEIEYLNENEDNIDEVFLIKAKIIDLFPKSVYPRNQFVFLKCRFCQFNESLKNQSNSVNAKIPSNTSQLLQCPQCSPERNSDLIYYYAIIFEIQDSNASTKVCLTKQNAVNVFGIEAIQVVNESDSALLLDNILFEIMKMSNQDNGLEWIIKKKKKSNYLVHEVISLAPLGSFDRN